MTREDFEQLRRVGRHLDALPRIGLLSPVRRRSRRRPWRRTVTTERAIFPTATTLSRRKWDLDRPGTERFDLLVASSVFMYSADPRRWFGNVLEACTCFLMVDIVRRKRSTAGELGEDGDRMRYALGGELPRVSTFFDLDVLGERVLAARTYPGGANAFDSEPLHVIALIRGDVEPDDAAVTEAIHSAVGVLRS